MLEKEGFEIETEDKLKIDLKNLKLWKVFKWTQYKLAECSREINIIPPTFQKN